MIRSLHAVLFTVGLMLVAPAYAATDASGDEGKAAAEKSEDRVVCERVKTVGSNMIKRQCRTVKQREEEREAARRDLATSQRRGG